MAVSKHAQGDYAQYVKEDVAQERVAIAKIKAQDAAKDLQDVLKPHGLEREINLIRNLGKLEDMDSIETALKQAAPNAS